MGMTVAGRKVVVFGGSGALGSAIAERLAGDGAEVTSADAIEPVAERRLAGVQYQALDLLDETAVAGFFASLEGVIWGVANVVGGYSPGQAVAELDLGILGRQIELNLVSAALLTKHTLARLAEQGQGGRIVHTSSRVAVGDGKHSFSYSVSKLGVIRLVEAAAAEMRESRVSVNCILPSVIDTPANRAAMPTSDQSRWPKPSELAAVVSFLLSEEAGIISGAAIPVYGLA
jgi:NAD(P)-dependent dehydrogenase (short-subunit alcohol dehydrogenase family)